MCTAKMYRLHSCCDRKTENHYCRIITIHTVPSPFSVCNCQEITESVRCPNCSPIPPHVLTIINREAKRFLNRLRSKRQLCLEQVVVLQQQTGSAMPGIPQDWIQPRTWFVEFRLSTATVTAAAVLLTAPNLMTNCYPNIWFSCASTTW